MALILYLNSKRAAWWKDHLQNLLPGIDCRLWHDDGDPADVLYAAVWRPPIGWLKGFPNLRCIVSVGAGIDHILTDTELPAGIPIIRTTGNDLTQRMREYVCLHVLRLHRQSVETELAQREHRWANRVIPTARERTVGIMGLGKLGADCATSLSTLGFRVAGWSRRKHTLDGVTCFAGNAELSQFFSRH